MKLTRPSNWRVVIDVERHPWLNSKGTQENEDRLMAQYAEEVSKAAKRHLDTDEVHTSHPRVEYDEVCKFCGYLWSNAVDEDGKPACCDKAISEWQALQPDSQQFGVGA